MKGKTIGNARDKTFSWKWCNLNKSIISFRKTDFQNKRKHCYMCKVILYKQRWSISDTQKMFPIILNVTIDINIDLISHHCVNFPLKKCNVAQEKYEML